MRDHTGPAISPEFDSDPLLRSKSINHDQSPVKDGKDLHLIENGLHPEGGKKRLGGKVRSLTSLTVKTPSITLSTEDVNGSASDSGNSLDTTDSISNAPSSIQLTPVDLLGSSINSSRSNFSSEKDEIKSVASDFGALTGSPYSEASSPVSSFGPRSPEMEQFPYDMSRQRVLAENPPLSPFSENAINSLLTLGSAQRAAKKWVKIKDNRRSRVSNKQHRLLTAHFDADKVSSVVIVQRQKFDPANAPTAYVCTAAITLAAAITYSLPATNYFRQAVFIIFSLKNVFVYFPCIVAAICLFAYVCMKLQSSPYTSEYVKMILTWNMRVTASAYPNEAPIVEGIPANENTEFSMLCTPWYLWRTFSSILSLLFNGGLTCPTIKEISDLEFGELVANSMCSHYLAKEGDRYILDTKNTTGMESFSGMYTAPTRMVFNKVGDGVLQLHSVTLNSVTFFDTDGPAWRLAKLYGLQSIGYYSMFSDHPLTHFPYDCINGLTKSILPAEHLLYKLLLPHFRFAMVLNATVLRHPNTVMKTTWYKPYTPFAVQADQLHKPIEAAYKNWTFLRKPTQVGGEFMYGRVAEAYYSCYRDFVATLAPSIPRDVYVKQWANEISKWLPGFPNATEICSNDDLFIDVITHIIFVVSLVHSVEHYSWTRIDETVVPLRLRIPPPVDKKVVDFKPSDAVWRHDMFKNVICYHAIFYPDRPVFNNIPGFRRDRRSMKTVTYNFHSSELQKAEANFRESLCNTEILLKEEVGDFIPLEEICQSTEY